MTPGRCTARIDATRRRGGFTLVELVIVLIVMATIAGLALPAYGGAVARYRLESAVYHLQNDSYWALAHARAAGVSINVRFDPAIHSVTFSNLPHRTIANDNHVLDLRAHPMEAVINTADFDGRLQYNISGFGLPDSGGTVVLRNGSGSRTLHYNATTGMVSVSP